MDITIHGDTLNRKPNDDQLSRINIELAAYDGEVGMGQVPLDDPTGIDDYVSGNSVLIKEAGVYLVNGWIYNQDRTRGPSPVTDREVVYTVQDPNALLFDKIALFKRPAETDVARVQAFADRYLPGVLTTWVLPSLYTNMPAKRYMGDGFAELIDDVVNLTSKTMFIHDTTDGNRCFHYHRFTTGHPASLSISDVPSAVNGTTVFAPGSPVRSTDASALGTRLHVVDQKGRAEDRTSTSSTYDDDGLLHQKYIQVEANSRTDLRNIADNLLIEVQDEAYTYTCDIGPLDVASLARIRVGDLVTCTSQVWGLTASAQRVSHMSLTPWSGKDGKPAPGLWKASLELNRPIRRGTRGRGKSVPRDDNPINTPFDPDNSDSCVLDEFTRSVGDGWGTSPDGYEWDQGIPIFTLLTVDGDLARAHMSNGDTAAAFSVALSGYDLSALTLPFEAVVYAELEPNDGFGSSDELNIGFGTNIRARVTDLTDTTWTLEYGSDSSEVSDPGVNLSNPFFVRVRIQSDVAKFRITVVGDTESDGWDIETPIGTTGLTLDEFYIAVTTPSTNDNTIVFDSVEVCTQDPPDAGQWVYAETIGTGDDVQDTFATDYAYVALSPKVFLDGNRVYRGTDYDESVDTHEFDFNTPPGSGVTVRADYQALGSD